MNEERSIAMGRLCTSYFLAQKERRDTWKRLIYFPKNPPGPHAPIAIDAHRIKIMVVLASH